MLPVGRMVLGRNPVQHFAEVEQAAFGTGVLVDGLDFSDDKMLQRRTLSYPDTQRYLVGPSYLQSRSTGGVSFVWTFVGEGLRRQELP